MYYMKSQYNLFYIWTVSLVAAMGGLLFGYDWVVIGGAKPFYEEYFQLRSSFQIGWAMSSALLGCLIGSMLSGGLSDSFGRKRLLILAGLLFIISAIGTALANSFSIFVWFRILGGMGIGLASNLSPMYIAEVAPAEMRGKFVSINQLTIVIGVLSAQTVNWLIAQPVAENAAGDAILNSWNGQVGWRWMFAAETAPAALFFILMFFVPESPRWLVKNGQDHLAQRTLTRIGGEPFARFELADIRNTLANKTSVNFRDLTQPRLFKILLLGIFLAVFQQWCGINTILYYAEEVFTAAGYGVSDILLNIVITGSIMLISTFLAIHTVDRWGRKILMLIGAGGLAVAYFFIGGSYFLHLKGLPVLLLVIIALAIYSFTLAPVVWVLISEIFPNRIRGAAVSIAVFSLWTASLILTYTFPFLNESLGTAGTYWLYAAICLIGFIVIARKLPETRGKSLEEIERQLVD
ncbi:sugar porter family MFS transporter [candidate division KSB1 bacterium]|nr:sugar porter family MFS transporter [candidate division KSB1 bacterium]